MLEVWKKETAGTLQPTAIGTAFPFLLENGHIVSLIGGGGKTTLLYEMAGYSVRNGKKVLIATSTHIYRPPEVWWKKSLEGIEQNFTSGRAAVIGRECQNPEKLVCPEEDFFQKASAMADLTFLEADGARHLPCKAPAEHEPALLACSDVVVGVTGLLSLNRPLQEVSFRPERAAELLGCSMEHCLTEKDLACLIASEKGQQKDLSGRTFYAVLHQFEEKEYGKAAEKIVQLLWEQGITQVFVTSVAKKQLQEKSAAFPWHGRAELPEKGTES